MPKGGLWRSLRRWPRCWLLILWEVNESERPAPAIEAYLPPAARAQARGIQSCVKARANVVEERR
eukprot:scaffold3802_cov147-Skeletonema_menzelii.AAC.1